MARSTPGFSGVRGPPLGRGPGVRREMSSGGQHARHCEIAIRLLLMWRSYSKLTLLANLRGSGLASAFACSRSESLKLARQLSNGPAITDIRPFEYCVEQVR